MLNCKEVAERSSALIDGELGLWESLQMRLHLAMCKGCEAFLGQMWTTRDLTRDIAEAEAPGPDEDGRITEILSQLHEQKQKGG